MPAVGDQHRGGPACVTMPNNTGSVAANPFEEPQRRISEYTAQEIATLQARLDKRLGPEYISSRPGAAGQKVHYLAADKCINLANEVFGFNGWSSAIQNIQIDFVEDNPNTGKISLGLSVIVRVTLRDGTFHEDIGYGHIENCKGKAAAFEKAKKEGTTDALKRALRNFGNVLGNCVYDKEYVSKVTKVKTAPAKWDVDDLHRHPDFAPIKKQPAPPKQISEDDDLPPPRPSGSGKSSTVENSAAFEGDGEFGSDLFDEADFVETNTGNPDEITLEPESHRAQPPTPLNGPAAQRGLPPGGFESSAMTPSKPERWSAAGPAARLPPAQNGRQNAPQIVSEQSAAQRRPMPGAGAAQNLPNAVTLGPPPSHPGADTKPQNINAQPPIKKEPGPVMNQDMQPPHSTPAAGFFSARAVDILRDNPNAAPTAAPQFDPHAESPSIRKTAGVDHSKSVPISKPMLTNPSPAANSSRDFINPATDMQRRVGAPGSGGGGGAGSPLNRGQFTSSYRPLTRPNADSKNMPNPTAMSRGSVPPQNLNGKRPPLSDVTNANASPGTNPAASAAGPNDPKRPRVAKAETDADPEPRPPQQPPQQQQQQP